MADIFNVYYKSISEYGKSSDSPEGLTLNNVFHKHSSHASIQLITDKRLSADLFKFSKNWLILALCSSTLKILQIRKSLGFDGFQSHPLRMASTKLCYCLLQ